MWKYVQLLVVVIACVALDQWTKVLATDHLASRRHGHTITLDVESEDRDKTLGEFLTDELGWDGEADDQKIDHGVVLGSDGRPLAPNASLDGHEYVELAHREIVVIDGYFDLEYARNPGAAFGFLAGENEEWRVPFFIVISFLAVVFILFIFRRLTLSEQLMIWSLSLIAGGAIGNLIDRVRFGWVTDFIVWKLTDAYRWPTFNLADAFISVGVGLMVVEMIRDSFREKEEESDDDSSAADESGED